MCRYIVFNQTPLQFACKYGNLGVIEYLVNQRADVNSKDLNDYTPLHLAAQKGHLIVVEYLVIQKADINAKNKYIVYLKTIRPLFIMLLNMVILVLLNISLIKKPI